MKIITIFPKDSEALFNRNSKRTFGGADIQMYLLTKELKINKQIDVSSFIVNYETVDFEEGSSFNLIKTYNENDLLLKKFKIYHKKINAVKPDIIIQRGLTLFSCLLAAYCYIRNIKFIFMFAHDIESHGKYQKDGKRCLLFPLLTACSYRLIVQNEYELQKLNHKRYSDKIKILKKGVDHSQIKKNANKKYDAIWIARCEPWKKPEVFIELAEKNKNDKFIMVCSKVLGKENYFYEIKSKAERAGNIKFIEFLKNNKIYELLAQCKVFCITSEMEGDWPMTVLEAAASGLPIISLHLNYGELFKEYRGGIFFEGNVDEIPNKLTSLINNNDLYKKTSIGAINYVNDHHNIKKNIDKFIEYIH